ncbi:putative ribonuclease H-like domain-containing protein [Tanacetum coccineum]|uniref:Ribonuclease H-like domain-containing protein n=1 Tax=Tanacetum coccineum TaxID=301880 RepID=A0ABQ4XVW3_9ASTR
MHDKFQMSAMGELNFFLGLQVLQKKDGIFLAQDKYVGDILKKFGFLELRSANTPMDRENPWGKDETSKDVDLHLYRSMIGSLMYLTASRPDIMFVVCACARHQVTPKECHLHAVKRIFRYLKGHPKLGLWYPKESPFDLVAYSDSDYGGASQDRKSTTGGCQFLGRRLISWQCTKQTIVATSITEAEYVVAASGCRQVLWIQNQLLDYGYNFMNTKIYIDNNSAICIVKNPVFHSRTKHIEIRHHFIRDCFEKKLIYVDHIHTDDNVADLLTKAFDVGRFQYIVCLSPKSTRFNEFSSNIATALVCLATNRTYNFSKMIFDGMMRNVNSKGKFLMYPRFIEKLLKMSQFGTIKHSKIYPVPFQTQKVFTTLRVNSPSFSGRTVPLFDTMIVQQGEGSENQLEPHHTPSTQHVSPPHPTHTSSPHEIQSTPPEAQTTPQASLPHTTNIPSHTPTPRRMTKRAIRISQSKALSPVADETAPPTRGDRYGEAFPTATSLDAGQDRENIPKTSAMPHESFPRVTSLGGDEGSLKQKLKELMEFCTTLQSQQTQMAEKIQSQDLEIKQLKARIQTLEDAQKPREGVQEDAPNRGGIDQGEVNVFKGDAEKDSSRSTDKGSESTGDLANVLSSMGAANILASGGLKEVFTTASPQVPPVSSNVSTAIVTASEKDPTAEVLTTARDTTPYTRRPRASRAKVQEQMSLQLARELQEEFVHKDQSIREQIERDVKIARIHAKEDLRQMINELNRSNVMSLTTHYGMLVREETSVNITPSVVKVYPYFESMLKDFDSDDLVTLWKLVKDRFKTKLPKSDLEKCLFWPLKVMFEPVATDLLWQFEAPIKSWKKYKSCKIHCLSMEGMIIYMLDDVEYPFQKDYN